MGMDDRKPKGGWSWISLCGVRLCGKTFRCLQESKAFLTVFHILAKILTHLGNQEADAVAPVQALATDPSVDTADWMHRKNGHCSTWMEWYITKDSRLPWEYNKLVNAVIACHLCSKQHPRQLLKESGVIHWSSQLMRDWLHYIGLFRVRVVNMLWFVWTPCLA